MGIVKALGDLPILFSGVSGIVNVLIEFQTESRRIRHCERAIGETVARGINDITGEGCDFAVRKCGTSLRIGG